MQCGATCFNKFFDKNNLQKKFRYRSVTQKFPIFQRGIKGGSLKKKLKNRCNAVQPVLISSLIKTIYKISSGTAFVARTPPSECILPPHVNDEQTRASILLFTCNHGIKIIIIYFIRYNFIILFNLIIEIIIYTGAN